MSISTVVTSAYMGGNGVGPQYCVQNGFVANWMCNYPSPHCLRRDFTYGGALSPEWVSSWMQSSETYCDIEYGLEYGPHGYLHVILGGKYGDLATMISPNE